jgi:hypothetical protein
MLQVSDMGKSCDKVARERFTFGASRSQQDPQKLLRIIVNSERIEELV